MPARRAALEPLHVLFFLDYDDGQGGRFANSPGLLPLVGYARQSGARVDFIDSREELLRLVSLGNIDVVAVSSMERMLPRSIPAAQAVRAIDPGAVLMLGGNSIESFAQDLAATVFDVVVTGEGEHVFPALLRALARGLDRPFQDRIRAVHRLPGGLREAGQGDSGGALNFALVRGLADATFIRSAPAGQPVEVGVSNVWLRDGETGRVFHVDPPLASPLADTASMPLEGELDATCDYPWSVVTEHTWEVFEFYTQRGCRWGRCEFCSIADRNIRSLSHDKILDVLAGAAARGVETISFSDDLFVQRTEWNRVLLERICGLNLGLKYRAQTMANRTVWPLLDLMREAGFFELAFGMETLSPDRARFMVKSYDGARYVQNACETVRRVAAAGMYPVLYMILVDPRSTIREVAWELCRSLELMEDVYSTTGILPKLSFNPVMLPVVGPAMTGRFPYRTRRLEIGSRALDLPTEFDLPRPLQLLVQGMAVRTDDLPYRRENLSITMHYMEAALDAAELASDPDLHAIRDLRQECAARLRSLQSRLDRDIRLTADLLLRGETAEPAPGGWPQGGLRFEAGRFGGYIDGLALYRDLLTAQEV